LGNVIAVSARGVSDRALSLIFLKIFSPAQLQQSSFWSQQEEQRRKGNIRGSNYASFSAREGIHRKLKSSLQHTHTHTQNKQTSSVCHRSSVAATLAVTRW
jgi:hypothetical protein